MKDTATLELLATIERLIKKERALVNMYNATSKDKDDIEAYNWHLGQLSALEEALKAILEALTK